MYIKKSVLVVGSLLLAVAVAFLTIMAVNPFGALRFGDLFKFSAGIGALNHYYYEDIKPETILDGALMGSSLSVGDPYTVYISKENAESFWESVESDNYTGIGLYIENRDNQVTVISALSGSPAEDAGITTGDRIIKVNGETVTGELLDDAAAKMKGKEGTDVKLEILKKSSGEMVEVTLTRRMIERQTVNSKMVKDKIGYIQITQFGVNTYDEFRQHFNKLVDEKMTALIVDLRNNPGGYIDVAVNVADAFIDEGEVVYTLDKQGRKRDYMAKKGATKVPMAILTNGGSASASEVFVGAMKDYGLAKSIGEKTFGKGVTQIPYTFFDGSILKITDSRYYTPKGVCIDKTGIEPDIEVKMSDEKYAKISELSLYEDEQLLEAVKLLEK